jgi:two-component system LytT family response regulator
MMSGLATEAPIAAPSKGERLIRVVLADDEVLARHKLRQLLREEPEVEIAGEGATAAETIDLVRTTSPDLLFLDIRMPGMDGFDIVRTLAASDGCKIPPVIFTTAYDSYALRAFEIHAVDYLLKPFTPQRLRSAMQRAREQINNHPRTNGNGNGNGNGHEANGKAHSSRMVFKSRGRILFLPVSEIRWIAAEENYVRISTGAETHLLRETMTRIEERLDPQMFLRVHRSAIVNLHFVKEVRTNGQSEFIVVLTNGQKVSMSRSYHARIGELLARK